MIIDTHTRIWSAADQFGPETATLLRRKQADRWRFLDASPAAHGRAMECVAASILLGFRSELSEARIPNEYVAEVVGKEPQRRYGVGGVDPLSSDALEEIARAVDLGLVGVAVSPVCQGFHPTHSAAMKIYEECDARRLPLFISPAAPLTKSSMLEFGRPSAWDEIARSFPMLPIVVGGLGYPWIDETISLLAKHERVFADLAGVASRPWQLYNALLTASAFDVMDKLLFGSGFPYETPAKAIETLYSINLFSHATQLPAIARSSIRSIVERNALLCLGLDSPPALQPAVRETGSTERSPATTTVRRLPIKAAGHVE